MVSTWTQIVERCGELFTERTEENDLISPGAFEEKRKQRSENLERVIYALANGNASEMQRLKKLSWWSFYEYWNTHSIITREQNERNENLKRASQKKSNSYGY